MKTYKVVFGRLDESDSVKGNEMNIIEAIKIIDIVYPDDDFPTKRFNEYYDAYEFVQSFVRQFDALAPTPEMWAKYPWAQWYTVDRGNAFWWENEPTLGNDARWTVLTTPYGRWDCDWTNKPPIIPIGIDWRECKWPAPVR